MRTALKMLFRRWKANGATTITTDSTPGHYDDSGEWVPPTVTERDTPIDCVILPLRNDVMQNNTVYTSKDREIYSYTALKPKQNITYKGVTYTVEEELDISDFGGVYVYTLKAVSAFANN